MSWPEDPESLLIGPRGRRSCWSLIQEMGGSSEGQTGPAWQHAGFHPHDADRAVLAAELAAAVGRADWDAVMTGLSDVAMVARLAESVTWAMYRQAPDGVAQALAHPGVAETLRPVAQAVAVAPAARRWSSGVELSTQQHVQPVSGSNPGPALSGAADRLAAWRTTTAEHEAAAAELPADPAANYSGHWRSAPSLSELISTTRALPGLCALQLAAVEDWRDGTRCCAGP